MLPWQFLVTNFKCHSVIQRNHYKTANYVWVLFGLALLYLYAFWPHILLLKQFVNKEEKIIIPFVFSLIYYVCFISPLTANPVNLLTQIDLVFCRYSHIKRHLRGFGCIHKYLFWPFLLFLHRWLENKWLFQYI